MTAGAGFCDGSPLRTADRRACVASRAVAVRSRRGCRFGGTAAVFVRTVDFGTRFADAGMRRSIAFFVGSRAITIGSTAARLFAASVVFGFVAGAAGNRGANVVFAFLVAVAVGVAGAAVRLGNALVVARLLTSGARQRLASVA